MRLRLVILTSLVAALHYYIGTQLIAAWPLGVTASTIAAGYLVLSTVLMPLGLAARALKPQPWGDALAWAGLLAMGFFSSLLVMTLARQLGLLLLSMTSADTSWLATNTALAVPILALVVTTWGFTQARRVARVVEVTVPVRGLPAALEGFRIAQISDIHVGPTIKHRYLARIVSAVNQLQPDMIAITGDIVDGSVAHLSTHTAPLADLAARHGVYVVTGNHEYYSGADEWIVELRRLGLQMLLNEHVVLQHDGASLLVGGVTDYTAHHFDESHRSDAVAALHGAPAGDVIKLLLAHQPRSAAQAEAAGFHLQLSGHTHGGQFWPWNLFVPLQQPYTAGLKRHGAMWVYISRGTGYWGPPKRLGSPSEITLLRLVAL